jgi:hypothetical protein
MNFALIALGFMVMLLAPSNIAAAGHPHSGVVGQVFIGPTCPVVTPGRDCSDRPFQTTISVYSDTGRFITEFTTTVDGQFRVHLKPGYYFLVPAGAGSPSYPSVEVMEVLVQKKEFTTAIILYDSGIR